jgi:hypothetical protein
MIADAHISGSAAMMMQAKMMMLTTKIVTPERVHWFPTMM